MNVALFLGAGFSAPFGHPTMDGFLGFADACLRLTDDDRSFLGRLVLDARRANSFLESSPTNIEDILSFSEMGERLLLTGEKERRRDRLCKIIQQIYTSSPPAAEYWPRYKALETLLGGELDKVKTSLSFITTNYDLNVESACISNGLHVDPGFPLFKMEEGGVQVIDYYYSTGSVPLYKLHGSVNWYASDNESEVMVDDRVVVVLSPFAEHAPHSLPYPCTKGYKAPGIPVIVPPSFLKPELLKAALRAAWQGAAKVLSTANVVVFVGYSFPPSDTEMMYFLARALMDNTVVRAVYIVDPMADAIVARLRGAGSKMGSHFRNLLRPINCGWTEATLPLESLFVMP